MAEGKGSRGPAQGPGELSQRGLEFAHIRRSLILVANSRSDIPGTWRRMASAAIRHVERIMSSDSSSLCSPVMCRYIRI
jgi:hypothetical protein